MGSLSLRVGIVTDATCLHKDVVDTTLQVLKTCHEAKTDQLSGLVVLFRLLPTGDLILAKRVAEESALSIQAITPCAVDVFDKAYSAQLKPQLKEFKELLGKCAADGDLTYGIRCVDTDEGDGKWTEAQRSKAERRAAHELVDLVDILVVIDKLDGDSVGSPANLKDAAYAAHTALRKSVPVLWIVPPGENGERNSSEVEVHWLSDLSPDAFLALMKSSSPRLFPKKEKNNPSQDCPGQKQSNNRDYRDYVDCKIKVAVLEAASALVRQRDFGDEPPVAKRPWLARKCSKLWGNWIETPLKEKYEPKGKAGQDPVDISPAPAEPASWRGKFAQSGRIFCSACALWFWDLVQWLRSFLPGKPPASNESHRDPAPQLAIPRLLFDATTQYRRPISDLATYFQGLHRFSYFAIATLLLGSIVLSFAAALTRPQPAPAASQPAVQTGPAPASSPAASSAGGPAYERWFTLHRVFKLFSLACIVAAIVIHSLHTKWRWHDRALDYRLASERLRHAPVQILLGQDPEPQGDFLPQYDPRNPRHSWLDKEFRWAIHGIRKDLVDGGYNSESFGKRFTEDTAFREACRATLVDNWLKKQINWHTDTARAYRRFAGFLEFVRRGSLLAALAVGLAVALMPLPLKPLDFLAVLLPAMASFAIAISGQAELSRLADRYAAMREILSGYRDQLANQDLSALPREDGVDFLRIFTEEALTAALIEAVEFRLLFQYRRLSSPV